MAREFAESVLLPSTFTFDDARALYRHLVDRLGAVPDSVQFRFEDLSRLSGATWEAAEAHLEREDPPLHWADVSLHKGEVRIHLDWWIGGHEIANVVRARGEVDQPTVLGIGEAIRRHVAYLTEHPADLPENPMKPARRPLESASFRAQKVRGEASGSLGPPDFLPSSPSSPTRKWFADLSIQVIAGLIVVGVVAIAGIVATIISK